MDAVFPPHRARSSAADARSGAVVRAAAAAPGPVDSVVRPVHPLGAEPSRTGEDPLVAATHDPPTGSVPATTPATTPATGAGSAAPTGATDGLTERIKGFGYQRFSNRDLSRLDFGARLLDLAEDDRTPLLERAKFLAIFSELLDEFFQVRVAGLDDQIAAGVRSRSTDGLRPTDQLKVIRTRVEELVARQGRIFLDHVVPALGTAGIVLSSWSSLDDDDRTYLVDVFRRQIFPVLTPLAVDPGHPFPYMSNLSMNLVMEVIDPVTKETRIARVKVPSLFPRFVVMPDGERFVPVEQVIAAHLDELFPGMTIGERVTFRVTRNADLAVEEDEADDLLVAVEMELRRRRFGRCVRLEISQDTDPALIELLTSELELGPEGVYPIEGPIDLSGLWAVYDLDRPDLHEETWTPMTPPPLATAGNEPVDLFALLRERDVLVQHPYDSFATSVEAFLRQAADDPDVLAIKQTLYRTGGDSPVVRALIAAAESGKQVAALVELKARFDEQANIDWARALEEAGVHVVYGLVGLKAHSKTLLVLRREEDGIRHYCHVGTGNYNSRTARVYEDLGLLTSSAAIGADVGDLFNYLTGFSRHTGYREILVAPVTLRGRIVELIDEQAALGPDGRIAMKLNGLTDPEMVDALYRASCMGVPIDLAVRGVCCLRPGIPELSETITVRSIVGRFLEHSRIYKFGGPDLETRAHDPAGGADGDDPAAATPTGEPGQLTPRGAIDEVPGRPMRILIGSADLMERNLDRRIEVLTPVHDPELQRRLIEILDLTFADDTHAWDLGPDRRWRRVANRRGINAQQRLQQLALERARRRRDPEARPAEAAAAAE